MFICFGHFSVLVGFCHSSLYVICLQHVDTAQAEGTFVCFWSAMNRLDDGRRFAVWASVLLGVRMRMELSGAEGFVVWQRDDQGKEHIVYDSNRSSDQFWNDIFHVLWHIYCILFCCFVKA